MGWACGAADMCNVSSELDVAATLARRTGLTHDWNDASQVEWLEKAGIDLVRGHARIAGRKRVEVTRPGGEVVDLIATHAVAVCTGSAALLPNTHVHCRNSK